ncbi:MAG TPA: MFS transporter [Anaerolineales bacterium]|nr:MFS transporter [Anaerolineales bacterium]
MIRRTTGRLARRFPALASRDFVLFLVGQFVSVIGTWMHNTAQPYLAYRISGRPLDLGIIGFATTLPILLLALPAGVLVERWDKRKTVIIVQAIMAVLALGLAALTFSGLIKIWHIIIFALVFGSASTVEITGRQSMLIELAGRDALPSAIALQTTVFNIGRVLGPLAASWLITSTGTEGSVFLANGISFIFVIVGLLIAKTQYKVPHENDEKKGMRAEFKEGISYIRKDALVATVILMSAIIGFFGFPLLQQIPALARDVLTTVTDTEAIVATRTSLLYAAQGAGALIAALMATLLSASRNKGQRLVWGQAAFIAPMIALGYVSHIGTSLVLLLVIGWGTVTQLVTINTLIQLKVPDELRGRVFSIFLWALQGVAPFGSLLIGWLAQNWGVPFSALVGGVIALVTIGSLHLLNSGVRKAQA